MGSGFAWLEVDADCTTRLMVLGAVVYRWPPLDFPGWGSPLSLLGWYRADWPSFWDAARAEMGKP